MTDAEIAAYLDKKLVGPDRDRVEDHLAECADCRRQMLDTKELLEKIARPKKTLVGGAIAAAAVVAFLIVRPELGPLNRRSEVRGDVSPGSLRVYAPLGVVSATPFRFVWSRSEHAVSYRLTVSRGDGQPIFALSTMDTIVALPDSVALRPHEQYVWVVDALLRDGFTQSTGMRDFEIAP